MDIKSRISTLWIVVMFNMAFADILTFITPGVLQQMMTGSADGLPITPGILLGFAVLIEIPIAMIFLSRSLPDKANRWINCIACFITILFVMGGGSAHLHYIFFATIEVVCMLLIMLSAIRWTNPEDKSSKY